MLEELGRNAEAVEALAATELGDWNPVFKKCRGNYVNLQFGDGVSRAISALTADADIFEMPGLNVKDDIDSVAALMCELDMVLTIPGTTEHLAGAIGVRTIAVTHPSEAPFRARPGTNIGTWSPNVEVVSGPPGRGFDGAIVNAARRLKENLRERGAGDFLRIVGAVDVKLDKPQGISRSWLGAGPGVTRLGVPVSVAGCRRCTPGV